MKIGAVYSSSRPSAELTQLVNWQCPQERLAGRLVPERVFILVDDPAPAIDRQPLGGNRRARDVAARAFQAAALVRLANAGGTQKKPARVGAGFLRTLLQVFRITAL